MTTTRSYQLEAICDCAESCVRALLRASGELHATGAKDDNAVLDNRLSESELKRTPNQSARETLHQLSHLAGKFCDDLIQEV